MKATIYSILFSLLLISSCSNAKKKKKVTIKHKSLLLESALNEVSGLQYLDSTTLLAVQDEEGIIYYVNSVSGKIKKSIKFSKKGDFEGITNDNDTIYTLRSDGTVFKYHGDKKRKCSFGSKKLFDFEGLCIDKNKNKILVACKKHGKQNKRDRIWIYQIGIQNFNYEEEPLFELRKEKFKVSKHFQPSGISINQEGNIVIISSYSHELLVINRKGKLIKSTKLNKSIFQQPEGITNAPNGTIYISNEKTSTGPNVLIFNSLNDLF